MELKTKFLISSPSQFRFFLKKMCKYNIGNRILFFVHGYLVKYKLCIYFCSVSVYIGPY